MARSAGEYDDALKTMIRHYKYECRPELAFPLASLLWQSLLLYWNPQQFDCIIPVPLHRGRLRSRGFNQAELLVRHWPGLALRQGIFFDKSTIQCTALVRYRNTPPQTGLGRRQRSANLKHAFKLSDSDIVKGCRVLLVDDVLTTGATVNACSRVLMRAGAASVKVLTLARAD